MNISKTNPVVLVAGPTASGKSKLAMDLAETFDGVIINADSMQVYAELRIITARPSSEDENRVPHRLYGVISATQNWSVGLWQQRVVSEIEAVQSDGKLPIVTGGTGLYFRALTHGLAQIPEIEQEIRDEMARRLKAEGGEALHRELVTVDAHTAARISPGDGQRLCRALEVYHSTGRALSAWIKEGNAGVPAHMRFHPLIVQPPRELLYRTINGRFEAMLGDGALDEVRRLAELGLDPALPVMKAVGVRELMAYLNHEISLPEAITRSQKISRNYAKRQLTWFRNQMPEAKTLDAQYSESLKPEIFSFIRQFVLT